MYANRRHGARRGAKITGDARMYRKPPRKLADTIARAAHRRIVRASGCQLIQHSFFRARARAVYDTSRPEFT